MGADKGKFIREIRGNEPVPRRFGSALKAGRRKDPVSHPVGWRDRRLFPFSFGDSVAEDELDLTVDAAEVIGGPLLNVPPKVGRNAEEVWFTFRRGHSSQL